MASKFWIAGVVVSMITAASYTPRTAVQLPRPTATGGSCELHVWPSEGLSLIRQNARDNLNTAYLGLFGSNPMTRANKDNTPVQTTAAVASRPLSPASQAALLATASLPDLLGVAGYRTVLHDGPLDTRTLRTVKTRYAASASPCYADLVVDDVVYSREYARGRNLKSFLRFRQFGDSTDAAPVRTFATWVQTKLRIFSIEPPINDASALAELDAAYRGNLTLFSQLLAKR